MTLKRFVAAILSLRRRPATRVPVTPEFGVRVMLRPGDKLVRRNADGEVEVTTITRGSERWM
jgi:hypothetical protein